MSDLISREKVIDVLKQTGIIQDNDLGHLVVDEINRIPTAYDVEAVVKQLKEVGKLQITTHSGRCNGKTLTLGYVKGIENAIEIVKAGGIDE